MEPIGRRALLGTGLALGAGAVLAGCKDDEPAADRPFDPRDWDSVRAQFPLDPGLAQFGAFMLAAHPKPVREAIERHRAGLDGDTAAYLERAVEFEEAARGAAAAYLGGKADDVALTDSTTMGMGLLCAGFRIRPGQSVLTTEHDFYGTRDAVRKLSERTGARVLRARLYDDPATATVDQIVSRLRARLQPRTRLVVVTWVHSSTGVRLPIEQIAAMLATANKGRADEDRALLFVDGVHGFGAVDTNVARLGCDFFTSGTHKWLFGPRGTGLLWGRAWDAVTPLFASFSQPEGPGRLATPGGYHSFEHRWAVPEAFAFHQAIGRDRIAARITEQATRLKDGLAGLRTVRLSTPKDPALSAGLVMCQPVEVSPNQAVRRLRDEFKIVASVTPYDNPLLRFGTGLLTTPDQVDRVIKAVGSL